MEDQEEFEIPDEWGLTEFQEFVIGSLIDARGEYIRPYKLCNVLYPDDPPYAVKNPAPAKLRVLFQRCREIVTALTDGEAEIETMRGKGWRITKRSRAFLLLEVGEE